MAVYFLVCRVAAVVPTIGYPNIPLILLFPQMDRVPMRLAFISLKLYFITILAKKLADRVAFWSLIAILAILTFGLLNNTIDYEFYC